MSEPAAEPATEPASAPEPESPRRAGWPVLLVAGLILAVAIGVATTPFWAPAVMRALPWSETRPSSPDPALATRLAALETARSAEAKTAAALATRLAALETTHAEEAKTAAALQALAQRLSALEAKPAPAAADLAPLQQQLSSLSKAVADLNVAVAQLDKAASAQPAADPRNTALALVLLQIREAVDVARPFKAEYDALLGLARDHPDIAAAAAPLEGPATAGVASRAALAERLHQLAPQIATARPPAKSTGWWLPIRDRLRSLVTIRHVGGEQQTPQEAAVGTAERAIASGDLAAAVAALDRLGEPAKTAAEPWLRMARGRLAVETALRRVEALVTTQLGAPAKRDAPG
jgi:hypothetical protein